MIFILFIKEILIDRFNTIIIIKMNKVKGMVKEGNACLFCLFALFNFFTFLAALGLLGLAIYLFVFTKSANVFNIVFLAVALALIILTLIAFKLRKSIHLLCMYLFILTLVWAVLVIFTIVMVFSKTKVVEWAFNNAPDEDK